MSNNNNLANGTKGSQGIQGSQGAQGTQGIQGAQGAQGYQGATGAQGTKGKIGAQGAQGYKGEEGSIGIQGLQGNQGVKGPKGAQGSRGCDGVQGVQGTQGVQGYQGVRGDKGAQGAHGCDGAQGIQGANGVQGAQGAKGKTGAQGMRGQTGAQGAQGAQGIQGAQGNRGEMGYQGDDGEIGIQGLVGENGAIWSDGIRLNGYNTHLFEYNSDSELFEPKNSNPDYLYIRNGARVEIYLTQEVYDLFDENNSVLPINRYEDGAAITTNYPIYYAGETKFFDKINEDTDLNTVVELVFKCEGSDISTGAWYYAGGLMTPTITDEIEVAGVTLGNLTDGSKIPAGTTIQELFLMMFSKEIKPKVGSLPKLSISFASSVGTVEVGSSVSNSINHTYTDGYFESSDKENYSNEKFNEINGCTGGKLNAGCEEGTITYKMNGSSASDTVSIDSVAEMDYNYSASELYGASTVVPKSNVKTEATDVAINAGTASASAITIQGRYKYFYGIQTEVIQDNVDKEEYYQFKTQESLSDLSYGYLDNLYETTIDKMQSSELKKSFAIVIPTNWDIVQTKNNMGTPLTINTTWFKQNTIEYTIGDVTTTYQVYVLPSTLVTEYQDIILTKHTN